MGLCCSSCLRLYGCAPSECPPGDDQWMEKYHVTGAASLRRHLTELSQTRKKEAPVAKSLLEGALAHCSFVELTVSANGMEHSRCARRMHGHTV